MTSKGDALTKEYEKIISLDIIDDEWKDHLRELDELKQAANNATFEQKDPLLIYKIESVKLFQGLISRMNDKILSMLFKSQIAVEGNKQVQKAQAPAKTDMSKMRLSSNADMPSGGGGIMSNVEDESMAKLSRADRRKQERDQQKKR